MLRSSICRSPTWFILNDIRNLQEREPILVTTFFALLLERDQLRGKALVSCGDFPVVTGCKEDMQEEMAVPCLMNWI